MSIMELKQVGYSYDNKRKVLKGINAEVEQGKLYAILGPSAGGLIRKFQDSDYTVTEFQDTVWSLCLNEKQGIFQSKNMRLAVASVMDRTSMYSSLPSYLQPFYSLVPPLAMVGEQSYREESLSSYPGPASLCGALHLYGGASAKSASCSDAGSRCQRLLCPDGGGESVFRKGLRRRKQGGHGAKRKRRGPLVLVKI